MRGGTFDLHFIIIIIITYLKRQKNKDFGSFFHRPLRSMIHTKLFLITTQSVYLLHFWEDVALRLCLLSNPSD